MRKSLIAATCVALAVSAGYGTFVWGAVGVDSSKLRNAVTVPNIRVHQKALQDFADANNGERTSGTSGFDASAAYVKNTLEAAGYTVTQIPFSFPFFKENSPPVFERTAPLPGEVFVEGLTFRPWNIRAAAMSLRSCGMRQASCFRLHQIQAAPADVRQPILLALRQAALP